LEDARKDYEILARKFSDRESYQLALGAIAERKNDKSTAISHYKRYLELAPQEAPEVPQVKARLEQLRNGPRTP
jgi:predicted Zn-dependent protease